MIPTCKYRITATLYFLLALISCKRNSGVDLSDKGQPAALPAKINKHIKPGTLVAGLVFTPTDTGHCANVVGIAYITYLDQSSPQHFMNMRIDLVEDTASTREALLPAGSRLRERVASVERLDYSMISGHLALAAKKVAALGLDYGGISSYGIEMAKDPAKIRHFLLLKVKSKEEKHYHEMSFSDGDKVDHGERRD